jgi:hypothetical protein
MQKAHPIKIPVGLKIPSGQQLRQAKQPGMMEYLVHGCTQAVGWVLFFRTSLLIDTIAIQTAHIKQPMAIRWIIVSPDAVSM